MKVWTCKEFAGHWPVGTAAVVAADTAEDAAYILSRELANIGLIQTVKPELMLEFPTDGSHVRVLNDGDY